MILSIMAGILGRMGGSEHGNRLYRTLGIPFCVCAMLAFYHWHWSIIICFGTVLGVTTTYWKRKGESVRWINWLFYGAMEGVALLPYALFVHDWVGFVIRTVACALLVVSWDELVGLDLLEEFGRYFIIAASIPLLYFHF